MDHVTLLLSFDVAALFWSGSWEIFVSVIILCFCLYCLVLVLNIVY